ncbi:S-layer homology domain-containing protein [Paenibacillus sp. 1001270B_150601_E10]|uniref:S-layer homology domain-containing protein n=1 Tax=Paenibacillus sp. 1001270B_150601_E10 TaxID=2787079 RepID=UPI00189DAA06|nr:S-layer homology domain-containing protein [Paenibacillus sp. 1001270B_150601_E10]
MNIYTKKWAAVMIAASLGVTAVPLATGHAEAMNHAAKSSVAVSSVANITIQQAIQELNKLGIMQGYPDQSIREDQPITLAELSKLLVKAFELNPSPAQDKLPAHVSPNAWYAPYAAAMAELGIVDGDFLPQGTVTKNELVQMVAKALKRDIKSVDYWAQSLDSNTSISRGEAAYLIYAAFPAIPSDNAQIKSVKALNAITLIVEMDKPLTAANEAFNQAKADFVFTNGLTLTNMPRLMTGSKATYIVPTSVQASGTSYALTYKGKAAGSFEGQAKRIDMTKAEQVTNDTFELEALKANGVVDYGYIISAYSGGRGANAFIVDQNLAADGVTYNIISSMQAREVTITPEGGAPIVAKYVPFTQSTDGRQEPKFRLPEGQVLTPGVTYTVTSDWATIANPTFTAKEIAPLTIASAEAINESSLSIELSKDPGDELFSGRSVVLTAPNGDKLTATYVYSSRKGAAGVFNLTNDNKLAPGTTYKVTPLQPWATAEEVTLVSK